MPDEGKDTSFDLKRLYGGASFQGAQRFLRRLRYRPDEVSYQDIRDFLLKWAHTQSVHDALLALIELAEESPRMKYGDATYVIGLGSWRWRAAIANILGEQANAKVSDTWDIISALGWLGPSSKQLRAGRRRLKSGDVGL